MRRFRCAPSGRLGPCCWAGSAFPRPRYIWWNFVASSRERIEQAQTALATGAIFRPFPGENRIHTPAAAELAALTHALAGPGRFVAALAAVTALCTVCVFPLRARGVQAAPPAAPAAQALDEVTVTGERPGPGPVACVPGKFTIVDFGFGDASPQGHDMAFEAARDRPRTAPIGCWSPSRWKWASPGPRG